MSVRRGKIGIGQNFVRPSATRDNNTIPRGIAPLRYVSHAKIWGEPDAVAL
jgi:hypothetical protein